MNMHTTPATQHPTSGADSATAQSELGDLHTTEAARNDQRPLYLVMTQDLIDSASQALTHFQTFWDEAEDVGILRLVVTCVTASNACAAAKAVQKLEALDGGISAPVDEMLTSSGLGFKCSPYAYLFVREEISEAIEAMAAYIGRTGFIRVARSGKRKAKLCLSLADLNRVVSIGFERVNGDSLLPEVSIRIRDLFLRANESVRHCLSNMVNACQTQRPHPLPPNGSPAHVIRISKGGEIKTATLKGLNRARKRAIYALARLGTRKVDTREFARLYGNETKDPYPTKTLTQAIGGVKKSIRDVDCVRLSQHQVHVTGIKIASRATPETLDAMLKSLR